MRRVLNKQISVKTLLTMLLIGVFCVSVMSATPVIAAQIQATIASHITVRYNGEVQHMRDANGNTVHPLVLNGTTYLPLRAAADMFGVPVNWIGETSTIELGNSGGTGATTGGATPPAVRGVRLREVSRITNNPLNNTPAEWTDTNFLPSRTDNAGNINLTYTDGIRFPTGGHERAASIRWDGSYSHLSFDVGVTGGGGARVRVSDWNGFTLGDTIWEGTLVPGEIISVSDLDVSDFGSKPLWISVSSSNRDENYVWILDPVLR